MNIGSHICFFQRRLISCYVFLLIISLAAYAQSGGKRFSGRVVDSETYQPVPFATVRLLALSDSSLLVGGATDAEGKFRLTVAAPKNKSLLLHVSFIGYTAVYREVSPVADSHKNNLGDIPLAPEVIALDETVVVGQAPMAVTEEDTTVFSASAFRTPEGSMLEDLVKQLPGGEIDADGKLLIHGKEVKKILVDGKEFFSDDPKAALKNLPVEMVEKLKAYERKSDLARLTGIDDGEEEMILDLSVKKNMKLGWMENFMGGYGSKDRYELANTLNRFRDNSQLTIIGNLNNTNNQGFSEMQKESAVSSGNLRTQKGLTTSRSLGINATYDWQRVKFRSNIQYVGTDRLEDSRTTVDNFLRQDKSITQSTGRNRLKNDNLIANAFLEWKMDSVTTLIFRPQYRTAANDRRNGSFQQGWGNDVLLNEKESSGTNHNSSYNVTMMMQLSRKLSRMGRNIALKVDYGSNASSTDRKNLSTTHYFKNNTEKVQNQKIEDEIDGYNYRVQLVYVEPLPWLHFLQFRYSYQYRANNSDHFVYNWDKYLDEFTPDYDEEASNCFENQYSNHLFNVAVRTSRKKYNYNIGADFEPQKSVSHSVLKDDPENQLERSVFNFSPTVNFRYKFSKRTRLQIVYRGKSRQPNIRDLQPVTDRTNPLNIRVGNPSLKPSYINTFTLNFNSYNMKRQRNMVATALVENTINSVTNQVTYDSETGVRTTTPLNLNGNWRALGSFSLNTPFRNRSWIFRTYSYLQYRNQNGYTTINKEAPVKSTVKHLTARQRLQLTYRTKQMEISARAELLYNNSHNNVKETRTETYDYRFGTEVQYYLPWGMELYTDLTYFQRSGYGYEGYARENLMWNCQLSKAFLKRKQLLLRFKIYDMLRQDVSMIRTITATAIRDTDYNALGSYFMVHAILRLNLMGR
ncbi:TonB-dependent receptor [Bacteroides difficilis]|uniref:TonB-dependent receptor n=1 Tax=Bacteroides difficilis TaxID=2763021 RepID=UPI003AAA8761